MTLSWSFGVLLGGLLATQTLIAQPVHIPDPALRDAICENLGLPPGDLTTQDLLSLTSLWLSDSASPNGAAAAILPAPAFATAALLKRRRFFFARREAAVTMPAHGRSV